MNGKKILTMLIVCTMMLSTMVVLNKLNINIIEEASAIPGVTSWGKKTNVTNTAELKVMDAEDDPIDIGINTTGLVAESWYYLYHPRYYHSGSTYNLTWKAYSSSARFKTPATLGGTSTFSDIRLNCSGLWIVVTEAVYTAGTPVNLNSEVNFTTYAKKWFWVNASDSYTLTVTPSEINYRNNDTITIELKDGDNLVTSSIFDIRRKTTNDSIANFPRIENDGTHEFKDFISGQNPYFTRAGNYTIRGYKDTDILPQAEVWGTAGWNESYGSVPAITADYYNYTSCGPWDPPEYKNSGKDYAVRLQVKPGEIQTNIPAANETMYWGFEGQVNISVKDYDGNNLSGLSVRVFATNATGYSVNVTANLTIDATHAGYIHITNKSLAGWGEDTNGSSYAENGTWTVYIWKDIDGDYSATNDAEYSHEWNTTETFTVDSAPSVQWKWIDDDGVNTDYLASNKNNDGVIPMVPKLAAQPLAIQFQIIGDDHTFYGTGGTVATLGENITVSGDALFLPTTLDKLSGVTYNAGTWTVKLTPIMKQDGGTITFSVYWEDYASITETLTIGGTKVNGSIVTISPTEFIFDENVSFTVTVKDATGHPYPNAKVYLYYVYDDNCTLINNADGKITQKLGGGSTDGQYTLTMNTTQQKDNQTEAYGAIKAPRNISAYVQLYRGGTPEYVYGYALAKMKARSEFKVTISRSTIMAGYKIGKMWFNTSVVDSSGNLSRYPSATGLKVRIYNATGEDVTAEIGSLSATSLDGAINKTVTNQYFLKPGTYTVHAYNDTYNSNGHNATFTVQAVDVTSSISELIWNVDKNISTTLTVTYNGAPINGTLKLYNITDVGTYNKTWVNESGAGNETITLEVNDGEVTLSNITASYLPGTLAQKNITYTFKPKIPSGSQYARASGYIPVKIATVTSPVSSIPYNKPAAITLTISGRGTGLADVFVSIIIPGLTGEMNSTTNADGQVTFAFTPPTTGTIRIKVENRTADTTIAVTSWAIYLDVPAEVEEDESFTVTARNGSSTGTALEGVAVVFNGNTQTTGTDGKATFTAPSVSGDRTFTVTATKQGYAEDSASIVVVNVPKLFLTVSGTPDGEGYYVSPVTIIVSDDLGNGITGATVTFGSVTAYSGANGITEFEVTGDPTTYTVTATKTGFTAAAPIEVKAKPQGIPGFELITLIAALGVAFILLRRRRQN